MFLYEAEFVISIISTIDFVKNWILSKHKVKFLFHMHSIIDLLATLPFYLSLIVKVGSVFGFLHILQIFRLIRILRLYRLFKDYDSENSDKQTDFQSNFSIEKQIAVFTCTIFACLFITAGISFELNGIFKKTYQITFFDFYSNKIISSKINYTFFDSFYLMCQTFLSLGWGDIIPIEPSSRILTIILVVCFVLILGDQFIKFIQVKSKISIYDINFKKNNHFIIIGNKFQDNILLKVIFFMIIKKNLSYNYVNYFF